MLARREAFLAGERARMLLELEQGDDDDYAVARDSESMRRRLARTLVHLGMKLDPLVGEEVSQ